MATRGWGGAIAIALGFAAGAAAAQLGVCYGLGIMVWTSATDPAGQHAWLASLTWTTWIAATSTVVGAVVADRLSPGEPGAPPPRRRYGPGSRLPAGPVATTAWRLALGLTAAVGGLLTVALVAVPARATHRPDTIAPQLVAGGYALVGVAAGVLVALAALAARSVTLNVVLTTGYLWALAIASVIYGYAARRELSTAQLALWRFGTGHFLRETFSLPGAGLMLLVALLLGGASAAPAVRRGDNPVGVAVCGAVGPVLVAAAYFLAAPRLVGGGPDEQLSAYLIAPYAVIAGLAGSVLVVALAIQRQQRLAMAAAMLAGPAPATAEPPATPEPPATAELPENGPSQSGPQQSEPSQSEPAEALAADALAADAYASPRAYESRHGGDASGDGPALVGRPGPVPLWPEQPDAAEERDAAP